jgi:hypothetical protein
VVGGSPTDRSGAFAAAGLSGVKARIALMLDIATQPQLGETLSMKKGRL